MKSLLSKKGSSGFTIIEVTIVLAIAGLIMGIVFVAVPSLQRSAHNTQRKSDASHLAGLVNDYTSNHAGTLPTCLSDSTCTDGSNGLSVSKEHWDIMNTPSSVVDVGGGASVSYGSDNKTMVVNIGATCDPVKSTISKSTNSRDFAIGFQDETSGGSEDACVGQ